MSYEEVKQANQLFVGTKQATRAVQLGKADKVIIANDADPRLTIKVASLCTKAGVEVDYVESMKLLGKACGIEVGAAVVAIVIE
ncbi:50S ribosomal protein L7ae-like protein [Paenibacillus albiflavus]|uniref:50S ribosomal protein L7ae-like protein n=1 Tax=Paenibacillus albiflavus TaxID=2545760 RepID=A0A4R4E0I3_9BACL|nr:ribosomal L7Ae/L30e/S12e/Gadd45 family protein [Paenibacillus albiflavus]TCZ67536.1 50S ribosomal protein L7ae-like protein [Paenibacillus albiflavus]